jgi:hypothetical protein
LILLAREHATKTDPEINAMTLDRYTRWQAAPIHLLISAVIATLVVGTMLLVWYPQPYFLAAGGITLVLLLVGVDVVLGPLLTLIVFDPKKKSLKIDLAIIAALQLAALAYGGWTMFSARPVYVAFAGDRFHLVAANEISPADLDKAAMEYRSLPLSRSQACRHEAARRSRRTGKSSRRDVHGRHHRSLSAILRSVLDRRPRRRSELENARHAAAKKSGSGYRHRCLHRRQWQTRKCAALPANARAS